MRFPTRSIAAIPSAQARAMLIKFYRLHSAAVESCPRDFYFLYFARFCGKWSRANCSFLRPCVFFSIIIVVNTSVGVLVSMSHSCGQTVLSMKKYNLNHSSMQVYFYTKKKKSEKIKYLK